MEKINSFLERQGFNEKDKKVYLDIYRHGASFASSVAVRTNIDRTTVYAVLKRLIRKGFVVQTKINKVRAYVVVSPEIFGDKINSQIETLEKHRSDAVEFAKSLSKLEKSSYMRPGVTIYEGAESVKNLYEQTLIKKSQQKCFLTIRKIPTPLKDFLARHFINEKIKKKVFSKVIIKDGKAARLYKRLDSMSNRETKLVSSLPIDMQAEIILFDENKIAIIDFNENLYGLLIESPSVFKSLESVFDMIWEVQTPRTEPGSETLPRIPETLS